MKSELHHFVLAGGLHHMKQFSKVFTNILLYPFIPLSLRRECSLALLVINLLLMFLQVKQLLLFPSICFSLFTTPSSSTFIALFRPTTSLTNPRSIVLPPLSPSHTYFTLFVDWKKETTTQGAFRYRRYVPRICWLSIQYTSKSYLALFDLSVLICLRNKERESFNF